MFTKCLKYFLAHTESLSNVIDVYKPLGGIVLNLMQGQWFAFSITIVKWREKGKKGKEEGREDQGREERRETGLPWDTGEICFLLHRKWKKRGHVSTHSQFIL